MSFPLDELSSPDSAKISLNLNEDILSKGSHLSVYSNKNIINPNINKNPELYSYPLHRLQWYGNSGIQPVSRM